ncbi:4-alpha-glucanotransferase [Soehngenia saccharolytica]|nr:4-alpha-glucanotransferase [Soehngenia saccharolytica]
MKKRTSGILMHISSLPSEFGIGDFGKEAYAFADFLERAGQKNWQILPLGVTGFGDSPYQCFSAFAGNPYFIDLGEFIELNYLTMDEIKNEDLGDNNNYVDYGKLYIGKYKLLRTAYDRAKNDIKQELDSYYEKNTFWLREFALFMSLKDEFDGQSWLNWPKEYRQFDSKEVLDFESSNADKIYFWIFTQYYFEKQWHKLKEYVNSKGIKIIGDLPIYVSEDSSDLWAHPYNFNLDENLIPKTVAGVPPDAFTSKGQLWGNPIYDWARMEEDGYRFWVDRIRHSFNLFDTLRIDHFRGFESYWEVPYGSADAVNGQWVKGPGIKLFNKIKEELGDLDIIAEDLGYQTEEVIKLIEDTGFPGMKILQFAFDPVGDSENLPHNLIRNTTFYTGTHDNKTVKDWFDSAPLEEKEFAVKYLKLDETEGYNWGLIRGVWSSGAYLAVCQMQDFLNLGEEARMNTPATLGNNWKWRIDKSMLTDELAASIKELTWTYRRE